ncbi:DUF3137 domain-containing protein [Altererythrobacter sp. RZ02]|uniref:DUF3137 domain-containing protein n=1 Tax=Pontixanthobacter rizhaonensis TaxID=2730337 RepID=A0A848QC32_9SPHN|nr:DUF3137 domain-containing protein [Pontixanthobacter rizhaonensis]NMW31121.1 DUF3137 domain-containing protein [Pontixanthobacter rizhaonensis]
MSEYPSAERLMAGPLGQWLQSQVAIRDTAREKSNSRAWTVAIIGLPLFAFVFILAPFQFELLAFLGFAAATGGWYWSQGPKRDAIKQVKTGINEAIADALGLIYKHDVDGSSGFDLAKRFDMLPGYDRASFEDSWSGNYSGHAFTLHEAHLEEQRGSGKNKRWVTVFQGSIIRIGFARKFYGTTLVSRAGTHRKMLGFGGRKDHVSFDGTRLDLVDMVHPDFEGTFDVYSTDQVEARYIVHPLYIEHLIAIEKIFSGEDICSLFHGGELVITLNCGNMFESGSIDASDDHRKVALTIDQFARLADLAQSLQQQAR